ncbi:hypothetical protein ACN23B_03495 [Anabaena sp. FACHB-709]|nr:MULTISPECIES: hypothetical protein [Nostocaceae]MBD2284536.1 hypothetical protein [Anabaena cylindrica FACHB-170]
MFQSLIGILVNCNGSGWESLIYLVFKVRLRELVTKVAFERSLCQE